MEAEGIEGITDVVFQERGVKSPFNHKSKKKIHLYDNPVLDFNDNKILENPEVSQDYSRLRYALSAHLQNRDVSSVTIDTFFEEVFGNSSENDSGHVNLHYFHPLAVLKYAVDNGFMISQCLGYKHSNQASCNRIKANGLWMKLPGNLHSAVMDYCNKTNNSSVGYCPECQEHTEAEISKSR